MMTDERPYDPTTYRAIEGTLVVGSIAQIGDDAVVV
jgi:hypothetical protein